MSDRRDREKCIRSGNDGFITKPIRCVQGCHNLHQAIVFRFVSKCLPFLCYKRLLALLYYQFQHFFHVL
jgi:hypothetical protein